MARITTKDCERSVPNRFELVVLAAERAHELWNGAAPQVASENDKPTVLALREIASQRIALDRLRTSRACRLLGLEPPIEIGSTEPPGRMIADGTSRLAFARAPT